MEADNKRKLKANLALLGVTFIWGITFVVVKDALDFIGPYYFLTIRFALAFLFLLAVYWRRMAGISLNELLAGVFIGIFLFGGYAFQTVGLQYTGAANAGFITGLSVVLVPLYVTFSSRRLPQASLAIGVLCSVTGLALLSLNEALRLNYGDILIFFCAACFAGHILMVGKYTARHSSIRLTVIQIGTVSVISLLTGLSVETFPGTITGPLWTALILTAIPATSLAFLIQNKVQKYTSATSTALIFTMEPVFAGLGAFLLAGETLSYRQLAGCILILAGMLATELKGNPSIPKKAASQ